MEKAKTKLEELYEIEYKIREVLDIAQQILEKQSSCGLGNLEAGGQIQTEKGNLDDGMSVGVGMGVLVDMYVQKLEEIKIGICKNYKTEYQYSNEPSGIMSNIQPRQQYSQSQQQHIHGQGRRKRGDILAEKERQLENISMVLEFIYKNIPVENNE